VTTGVVVGGVFLAGDQLLGVEELTVGAESDLVDDGRLEVDENSPRMKNLPELRSEENILIRWKNI
jgi:hypothetical protein